MFGKSRKMSAVLAIVLLAIPIFLVLAESETRNAQIELTAQNSAKNFARASHQFRQFYIDEVMPVVKAANIPVVMDVHGQPNALPLAYTAAIDICEDVYDSESGGSKFVSDYPFREREEMSSTEASLWSEVKATEAPAQAVHESEGERWFTYAEPIYLTDQFCADCHNSHPESGFRDWKAGDLRGAELITLSLPVADSVLPASIGDFSSTWIFGLAAMIICMIAICTIEKQARLRTQEQLESKASQAERVKLLAGGVAHHFNNLFSVVIGNAELQEINHGETRELSEVKTSAKRGAELVEKLLCASKARAAMVDSVDLVELITKVKADWTRDGLAKNLILDVSLPDKCVVSCDDEFLKFILHELLGNAFEHANKHVSVSLTASPEKATLTVKNDCQKEPVLAHSVEPFFTTHGPDRAGLGLSAVAGMIDMVGGEFEITSDLDSVQVDVKLNLISV